jgi:hypothetical protein
MKTNPLKHVADPINEARRYVDNAKTVLFEKAKLDPETNCYADSKYVKAAGHYLWNAVLISIDAIFEVKSKQRPHPDVNDYREAIAKRDRKLLSLLNASYDTAHITMGYDGNVSKDVCIAGIRLANDIIDRCEAMLKQAA